MTKLLEQALKAVQQLPDQSQDEIAQAMLHLARSDVNPEIIPAADLSSVLRGLEQAQKRQFVSDSEIEATFRRFDHAESCPPRYPYRRR
ncbi:MAG TPA: hypothetical protein VIJ42_05285 [Stellaceae bacterium]